MEGQLKLGFYKRQPIGLRGLSIATVLVGLALGALVLLGLTQVFVQFEKVKVADTRESDLRGLLQLAGLAMSPTGPVGGPSFRNSCDETFNGSQVINSSGVLSFSSPAPLKLNLGFGPGSELIAPSPAANSRFGAWTLQALEYIPSACRLVSNPIAPCTPTTNTPVLIFGNIRLTLTAFNPLTNQTDTRQELFPVKVVSATPSAPGQFPLTGCRGNAAGPGPTTSLTIAEDLCNALCFVGSGSPASDCWIPDPAPATTGKCIPNRQICAALNAPGASLNGVCNFTNFRRDALVVNIASCPTMPLHAATGFLLETSAVHNFECAPTTSGPASCSSCWIKANTNAATSSPFTAACPGTESKWFEVNAGGALTGNRNCGFPQGRVCPRNFSGCGITPPI